MQGYIEEDPNFEKVKKVTEQYIDTLAGLNPKYRLVVLIEHEVIKHMGCNRDMQVHEMLGLINIASNRLGMIDLDSIKMRLEAARVKQDQDEALSNMALKSKMSN